MVDFRSGYVPPGVYVSTDSSGSVGVVGLSDTVICLIGKGLGYNIFTDTVSFAGGNAVVLTQRGIDPSSVVVTGTVLVGGIPTATTFAVDEPGTPHDYSLTQDVSGTNSVTTIHRTVSGEISTVSSVTVTYHYTNADYYALNSFSDYASFEDVYGIPFDPATGTLISPLSLAAQVAFQNGASSLRAIALSGSGSVSAQFQAAYDLALPRFDVNIMVPLFDTAVDGDTASGLIASLVSHLNTAEDEGFPRVAIVGLPQAFSGETPDVLAQQVNHRRVVLTWPQQFLYYNSIINQTQSLDGFYFAAACAGALAGRQVSRGLTHRQIRTFAGISAAVQNLMTTSNKNVWSSKGVAVAEIDRNNRLIVRHGVTTATASLQNREISIVRSQDSLFALLQVSLNQAELIGDPITAETPLAIKSIVAGVLEAALAAETIQDYKDLLVRQQQLPTGDPTVIECTFSYRPTYPLNYITVVFTLDLTNGTISTSDTTAIAA